MRTALVMKPVMSFALPLVLLMLSTHVEAQKKQDPKQTPPSNVVPVTLQSG
jgi:hypothetical protein